MELEEVHQSCSDFTQRWTDIIMGDAELPQTIECYYMISIGTAS